MQIGIIGAGAAGAVASLAMADRFLHEGFSYQPFQITCIHDENIPIAQVGEGISPSVIAIMQSVLGLDFFEFLDDVDGTPRYFSRYHMGDLLKDAENFHLWHMRPGAHVNSQKFSKYITDNLAKRHSFFSKVNDSVVSIEQNDDFVTVTCKNNSYKFDYILDCRGNPTADDFASGAYVTDPFESVNAVILYPDFKKYEEPYTSVHFHDNGWMFGVPLQHRKAWGFLYNKKFLTKEQAGEKYSKLKNIDTTDLLKLSWDPYYKKKALDGRILALGNKLYFFEPHHAIPLHYYLNLVAKFIHEIFQPPEKLGFLINAIHLNQMEQIQDIIALNYIIEHDLDSDFWNYIRPRAIERLKNSKCFQVWINRCQEHNRFFDYSTHDGFIMEYYIKGYNIDLNLLKNDNPTYHLT
jgi:Tryptophan halogenase